MTQKRGKTGRLVIVQTAWGIPMIARLNPNGSGIVEFGMFKDRPVQRHWKVCQELAEGDVIEDLGLTVCGDELVAVREGGEACS